MKVLGLGDNVVDKYENLGIMYPGGNSLNFAVLQNWDMKVALWEFWLR